MNVVRHHHEGMQATVPEDVSRGFQSPDDHIRDGGLAKMDRTTASLVEHSIRGGKCLTGVERAEGERLMGRQAVMETPGEERGRFRFTDVGKAPVERHAI